MFRQRRYVPSTQTLVLSGAPDDAPLADPGRLRAVLEVLREEPPLRSLVLAEVQERRYGPRAVGVLNALLALGRLLERQAARDPAPDFPGEPARKVRARCAACPFLPRRLFPRLTERLLDLRAFHAELELSAQALSRHEVPGCGRCVGLTRRDLEILLSHYALLRGCVAGGA